MIAVKLVYPSKKYEKKTFECIKELREFNSEINGTCGLDRYDDYDE